MASDDNFDSILDRQWDDIPEPKTLPVGSWIIKARNASYQPAKGEGNASVLVVFEAQEPLDDVDAEALEALGNEYPYDQNRIFHRVWLETGADVNALKTLLAKLGVQTEGKSVKESLKDVRGKTITAHLGSRIFKNSAQEDVEENTASNFTAVS